MPKNLQQLIEQATDQWTTKMSRNATEEEIVAFWNGWMKKSYRAGAEAAVEIFKGEDTNKWNDAEHCTCLSASLKDAKAFLATLTDI